MIQYDYLVATMNSMRKPWFAIVLFQACMVISARQGNMARTVTTLHNIMRSSLAKELNISNMQKLIWSEKLASNAKSMYEKMKESNMSWTSTLSEEELNFNFGVIGDSRHPPKAIIERWFNEKRHFSEEDNDCFEPETCKNFRHMTNAMQTRIGCHYGSLRQKEDSTKYNILICRYKGGTHDMFEFELGPVCSACEAPTQFCSKNLCVACNPKVQKCECKKTCSSGGAQTGTLITHSCRCLCAFNNGPNCDRPCADEPGFTDVNACEFVTKEDCSNKELKKEMMKQCPLTCQFCTPQQK